MLGCLRLRPASGRDLRAQRLCPGLLLGGLPGCAGFAQRLKES